MATRVTVNGVAFTGNPCRILQGTFNGRPLKAGERVWAALFFFQAWLDAHHPGLYLYVIQSAYHEGYDPSAGTHDKDRVLDVAIINRRTGRRYWLRGRRWLRRFGWAAWWRHTGSWLRPSTWHIHMVLLGGTCPVGSLVPDQIRDYYAHKTGLLGHLLEPGWYPPDIDATVFDFEAWLQQQEDDMPYTPEELNAIVRDAVKAELEPVTTELKSQNKRFRSAVMGGLRKIRARTKDQQVLDAIDELAAKVDADGDA